MSHQSWKSPSYDPELFVNRTDDIELVTRLVVELVEGKSVPLRTVVFRGEQGSGKTWLLRHLDHLLNNDAHYKNSVVTIYLSLDDYSKELPERSIRKIAGAVLAKLSPSGLAQTEQAVNQQSQEGSASSQQNLWESSELSLREISALLMHNVGRLLENKALVILLDHVYESRSETLLTLEDYLLAPLAQMPRVLIVMAGRGRGYAWKAPELRLRFNQYWLQGLGVAATEQPALSSLMQEADVVKQEQIKAAKEQQVKATEEQLRRLPKDQYPIRIDYKQVPEILSNSHGHPLTNLLLGLGKSYGDIVAELLKDVSQPEQQVMLRLVCVLRFFDEPQIKGLLAVWQDDAEFTDTAGKQPREIISSLLQTNLVRYDANLAAYVMDEVIRGLLEGDLEERRRGLWQRLHQAALDMYCRWMREYPQARKRLEVEAKHHAKRLGKLDAVTGACREIQTDEECSDV